MPARARARVRACVRACVCVCVCVEGHPTHYTRAPTQPRARTIAADAKAAIMASAPPPGQPRVQVRLPGCGGPVLCDWCPVTNLLAVTGTQRAGVDVVSLIAPEAAEERVDLVVPLAGEWALLRCLIKGRPCTHAHHDTPGLVRRHAS